MMNKIRINNNEIEVVNKASYLGILFNNKLSFKPQITHLIGKLRNTTRALIATRRLLNK